MKKEEVIEWLTIMKANLNSFPEVSNAKKIEALGEAIRLFKNEQSIDKVDCDHTECRNCINHKYCDYEISSSEIPNKSIEEKCPCYDCEYFEKEGLSHCKIHEGAYGDCRCNNYHKVNQDLNKVNQDSNKSEIPTGSNDCISRQDVLSEIIRFSTEEGSSVECQQLYCDVNNMPSVTPTNKECVDCVSRKAVLDMAKSYNTERKYQQLRADYENHLKADLVAMLTEIQLEIEEHEESIIGHYGKETKESDFPSHKIERNNGRKECVNLIQQKIAKLKG